jgi:hypothetical protein
MSAAADNCGAVNLGPPQALGLVLEQRHNPVNV